MTSDHSVRSSPTLTRDFVHLHQAFASGARPSIFTRKTSVVLLKNRIQACISCLIAAIFALVLLSSCSSGPTVEDGAPESVQRDALESTWEGASEDERRDQCDAYSSDPIGAVAEFEENFDYDVVKEWLEAKC